LFASAVFWVARHGCAWRARPWRFGKYDTLYKRSQCGVKKGAWQCLFKAKQKPDLDWVMLDSTIVRVHA
jgi:transposase